MPLFDILNLSFPKVNVGSSKLSANKKVVQKVVICNHFSKKERLDAIMSGIGKDDRVIIFCNTKRMVGGVLLGVCSIELFTHLLCAFYRTHQRALLPLKLPRFFFF